MFGARQKKPFLFKSQDNWFLHLDKYVPHPGAGGEGVGGGGGRALRSNRLMGMCRWMGSHFYHWIDCHEGIAFSTELLAHSRDLGGGGGENNPVIADFKT